MQVIPVLDLKGGVVVHARYGERANYAPLCSPLCPSAELDAVIAAYLRLYDFPTFYIADLDAITGKPHQKSLLASLLARFPQLTFWIDSGYQQAPGVYSTYSNYFPVLGSEAYAQANYLEIGAFQKNYCLSLDFKGQQPLGAAALFTDTALWPQHVIIMALHRVGGGQGPDFAKLTYFQQQFLQKDFIAAGGIRNLGDLKRLLKMGIKAALVASALHSGAISADDLRQLAEYPNNAGRD